MEKVNRCFQKYIDTKWKENRGTEIDRDTDRQRVKDTQAHRETASFIIFCSTFDNYSSVLHFHPLDVRRSLF